jgi:UDP-glucose 4-epimerase
VFSTVSQDCECRQTFELMRVLVTGGAGYIGSVVTEELLRDGHDVVVYDNLSRGHREAVAPAAKFLHAEIADAATLSHTFRQNRIEAVVHMAADSLVGESVGNPARYYQNNLVTGLGLLDAMRECELTRIVFSSTAATYGEPPEQPIQESAPTNPTNPYGASKLAFEQALRWYDRAYGLRYATLRYFNAAGASANYGESHDPETHLIPLALQAAAGKRPHVEIYGDDYPTTDGTCVRDYVHVIDLARAHILALEKLASGSTIYNLGCGGEGYSVRSVIEAARDVTGREIVARVAPRRAGDPPTLVASSDRIRNELGWQPQQQDLHTIIESAWKWMLDHPNGYN